MTLELPYYNPYYIKYLMQYYFPSLALVMGQVSKTPTCLLRPILGVQIHVLFSASPEMNFKTKYARVLQVNQKLTKR